MYFLVLFCGNKDLLNSKEYPLCSLGIPFPRVGQEMYKMKLEHLITPDSRKLPKAMRIRSKALIWQTQEAPTGLSWKNFVHLKYTEYIWCVSNKFESIRSNNTKKPKNKNHKKLLTGHLWRMLQRWSIRKQHIVSIMTNNGKYSNYSSE